MMDSRQIWKIYGTDYREMTKRLLEQTELVKMIREKYPDRPDARIGIKPNLVCPSPAQFGATTHPEIVEGLIEYLHSHGFRNILIAEGSWVGDRTSEAYEYCGYRALCERQGVDFVDCQKQAAFDVDAAGMTLQVSDVVKQIDFLINVPVLKGHCQTKMTCALKNMKGLLPNSEKRRFHQMGLHRPIAHLSTVLRPDYILVDHICGDLDYEEGGNPVIRNCIMAALDPVLTDSYACFLLGYTADDVPYVRMAETLGCGSADLEGVRAVVLQPDGAVTYHALTEEEEVRGQHMLSVAYAVDEIDSCSACYASLIPALDRLQEEGLLERLDCRIAIGQGQKGRTGPLGVGRCTSGFDTCIMGCPPGEEQIYQGLKRILEKK